MTESQSDSSDVRHSSVTLKKKKRKPTNINHVAEICTGAQAKRLGNLNSLSSGTNKSVEMKPNTNANETTAAAWACCFSPSRATPARRRHYNKQQHLAPCTQARLERYRLSGTHQPRGKEELRLITLPGTTHTHRTHLKNLPIRSTFLHTREQHHDSRVSRSELSFFPPSFFLFFTFRNRLLKSLTQRCKHFRSGTQTIRDLQI